MTKTAIHFMVGLLTLLVCVTATVGFLFNGEKMTQQHSLTSTVQNIQELRLEIPDAEWEPAFFKALEERTKKVNLPSLRTVVLPENDLEVRFWYDARPNLINGFVIRYTGGQWSAIGIRQITEQAHSPVKQEALPQPKSGWQAAWKRLVSAGITTLPDGSEARCHSEVLDGVGYVIETNVDRVYRTYRYSNPQFAKCGEAKQVLLIEEIIADEFGLQNSLR